MEKNEGPENALKVAEPMPASPPAITNGASDPEEDDLDDLDGMDHVCVRYIRSP